MSAPIAPAPGRTIAGLTPGHVLPEGAKVNRAIARQMRLPRFWSEKPCRARRHVGWRIMPLGLCAECKAIRAAGLQGVAL